MSSLDTRFWAKVNKTDTCWNWTAAKAHGYGRFQLRKGKQVQAHRVAYELTIGPIPDGMVIDHICHNTACVKPSHLRLATNKQNLENRAGADRDSSTGVRGVHWNAKANKYHGSVQHNRKRVFVGYFTDLSEADAAVTAKRNELFTHNDLDRVVTK